MSKDLIVTKENIFTKIKRFFLNIFRKKELKNEIVKNKDINISSDKSNFKDNIVIKQDEEEVKIANLQKDYKGGKILEEDMTDDEHKKLIELYKKQNSDLREKIDTKKKSIKKRLNDLKAS